VDLIYRALSHVVLTVQQRDPKPVGFRKLTLAPSKNQMMAALCSISGEY
jgi:hypothetical protein